MEREREEYLEFLRTLKPSEVTLPEAWCLRIHARPVNCQALGMRGPDSFRPLLSSEEALAEAKTLYRRGVVYLPEKRVRESIASGNSIALFYGLYRSHYETLADSGKTTPKEWYSKIWQSHRLGRVELFKATDPILEVSLFDFASNLQRKRDGNVTEVFPYRPEWDWEVNLGGGRERPFDHGR